MYFLVSFQTAAIECTYVVRTSFELYKEYEDDDESD